MLEYFGYKNSREHQQNRGRTLGCLRFYVSVRYNFELGKVVLKYFPRDGLSAKTTTKIFEIPFSPDSQYQYHHQYSFILIAGRLRNH